MYFAGLFQVLHLLQHTSMANYWKTSPASTHNHLTKNQTHYIRWKESWLKAVVWAPTVLMHSYADLDERNRQVGLWYTLEAVPWPRCTHWRLSWSRANAERAYDATQKNFQPLSRAIRLVRPHLDGPWLILWTYPIVLRWIPNVLDATKKPTIWCLQLSEMEFDVVYRAGVKHQAAKRFHDHLHKEYCAPIANMIAVMAVVSSPWKNGKVGTQTTDIIYDHNDDGLDFISPVLPTSPLWWIPN